MSENNNIAALPIPNELKGLMQAVEDATAAAAEPVALKPGPELTARFNAIMDHIGTVGRAQRDLFALFDSHDARLEQILENQRQMLDYLAKLDDLRTEAEPHIRKLRKLMMPRALGGKFGKD